MRKFLVAAGLALTLAGCDPNVATPNQVLIAVNAYNTAVVSGTVYLKLPLCAAAQPAPCRTQALSQSVYTALRSGRAARGTLLADLAANTTVPITLIQTLQAAYAVLSALPTN